jgi:AbrB family looped-hinge helix DNA binding protein
MSISSKVTSKLQVTIPKAIAEQYGIEPGDEITWVAAGGTIRVVPAGEVEMRLPVEERLRLFDAAVARQREREKRNPPTGQLTDRGWTREDLYEDRGRAR